MIVETHMYYLIKYIIIVLSQEKETKNEKSISI